MLNNRRYDAKQGQRYLYGSAETSFAENPRWRQWSLCEPHFFCAEISKFEAFFTAQSHSYFRAVQGPKGVQGLHATDKTTDNPIWHPAVEAVGPHLAVYRACPRT